MLFNRAEQFEQFWCLVTQETVLWLVLKSVHWFSRRRCWKLFFSIYSSVGHLFQQSEMVWAISVEGHLTSIPVYLFKNPSTGKEEKLFKVCFFFYFYTPVWRTVVLCYTPRRPSVCPSVFPSVCKRFRVRVTPPTVYVRLSWNLVYSKAMRLSNAYFLEVVVQRFLAELHPFYWIFSMFVSG